jgi:hypothetical protein
MVTGADSVAKITNATCYSGEHSLYMSGSFPSHYRTEINQTPFTSAPLTVYLKAKFSDPTGGTKAVVQTKNGANLLAFVGIYGINWQYYDGASLIKTSETFDNTTWYKVTIIHEFSNDTYNAWVTGGIFDNWQIVHYASLRTPGLGYVNRTELFGGTSWAGGGGNVGMSWYDNLKIGDYASVGIWESASQAIPTGYRFRNTSINFSGLVSGKQEINSVNWLVNDQVKASFDTDIENDLESTKTIDLADLTSGDFNNVTNNFTVKLEMITDGNGTPVIYQIDNNLISTSGELTSMPIKVPWNRLWDTVNITKTVPAGTSLKVTVLDGATSMPIQNYIDLDAASIDLTSLSPIQYPTLKLRASFKTNSTEIPLLQKWLASWKPDLPVQVNNIPSNLSFPEDTDALRFIDLGMYFNDTYTPDNELFFIVYNESNSDNIHASINGRYLEFITPTDHWEGNETFSINCSDGEFVTTSNSFMITVTPINDPPIWKDITDIFITEGSGPNETENIIDLLDYVVDVDNSSEEVELSIVLNTNPNNISVVIDSNNMIDVNIANENYVGTAGVTLRAFDGLDYSDEYFNIIIESINDIPTVNLIYPDDQAIVTSNNVDITWSGVDVEGSMLTFDLYLTTTPDADTAYMTNITSQNITLTLTDGKYYWQVIPYDGTEYGECLSEIWEFTVDSTIQTPTTQLISPVYNSIVTSTSVDLRWEVGEGFETTGLTYEIYLDINEQPKKIVPDHHGLVYTAHGLEDGKTYYWTIIPKMPYGLGSVMGKCISGVWSFEVDFSETAPVVDLLSPGNSKTIGTVEPTLLWTVTYPAATSIDYIIYLDTSPDPVKLLKSGHSEKFITAMDLENGNTYHWTVIPIAGNVMGTCNSGVWQFTVDTGTAVPEVELNYPINKVKINTLEPQLNWTLKYTGSGSVTFDIYLDTIYPPTKLIENDYSSGNKKQVTVVDKTRYYWTVIPTAGNVEGYCLSGVWSFETDMDYKPVFGVILELTDTKLELNQGQFGTTSLSVLNNGNEEDIVKLYIKIEPTNLDEKNIILEQSELTLANNYGTNVRLTINIPNDAKTGDYKITVTAVSQGALGLNQDVHDAKILEVEVTEEAADVDESLYLGSIAVLIIIIVILIILFLLTVRKKKKVEEKPEERAAVPSVPGPEEVMPPLAPPVEPKPEGEKTAPAPLAPEIKPEEPPKPEPEPEGEQPPESQEETPSPLPPGSEPAPAPSEPEPSEPETPSTPDESATLEEEIPDEDEPLKDEEEAMEEFETEKEPISDDEIPVEEEPVAETDPIKEDLPVEETPEPEVPPSEPTVMPKVSKPGDKKAAKEEKKE